MPPRRAAAFSSGSSIASGSRRPSEKPDDHIDETSSQPERNTKRTGQACTRCKSRKIKCDASINGCKPCRAAGEVCATIDRNSGAMLKRSHNADLDLELHRKSDYIEQLHAQLRGNDIIPIEQLDYEDEELPLEGWRQTYHYTDPGQSSKRRRLVRRDDAAGERFLGDTGNEHLSVIQGSRLTLFDHHFDFFDFFPPNSNDTVSSYELSEDEYNDHIYNCVLAPEPEKPQTYEFAKNMTAGFFLGTSFFTPIVHRPSFYDILQRKYESHDSLTEAENIIFIMVMSIAGFQWAVRSNAGADNAMSIGAKQGLLYCLNKYNRLIRRQTVEAMQALALMCVAMRALRRPGPAWEFCDKVLGRAVTLGYHLGIENWPEEKDHENKFKLEMQQRIFWSIIVCYVNVSGNLGRPMRLDRSNIDVRYPEPSPDYVEGVDKETAIGECSWKVAPYGFRLTWIMLGVYLDIGATDIQRSTRKANARRATVELEHLHKKIQLLTAEHDDGTANATLHVAELYLRLAMHSTSLLVRHPRYLRAQRWELSEENLDDLLKDSRRILEIAEEMRVWNSLDTTVYYNMNFVYAIFVELYVSIQRTQQGIFIDQEQLRQDMAKWDNILQAVGAMIGTADRLAQKIRSVVSSCFEIMAQQREAHASTVVELKSESRQELKPSKRKSKTYSRKNSSQPRSPFPLSSGIENQIDETLQPDIANLGGHGLIPQTYFDTLPQGTTQPPAFTQSSNYSGYERFYSPTGTAADIVAPPGIMSSTLTTVQPQFGQQQLNAQHMATVDAGLRSYEFINHQMPTNAYLDGSDRHPRPEAQSWHQFAQYSTESETPMLSDETGTSMTNETIMTRMPAGQHQAIMQTHLWSQQ